MRRFVLALCTLLLLFTVSAAIVPVTVAGAAPAERVSCDADGCTIFVWWGPYAWWCGDDPATGAMCACESDSVLCYSLHTSNVMLIGDALSRTVTYVNKAIHVSRVDDGHTTHVLTFCNGRRYHETPTVGV